MESAGLKNPGQQMPVSVQKQGEEEGEGSGRFLIFDLTFCLFSFTLNLREGVGCKE